MLLLRSKCTLSQTKPGEFLLLVLAHLGLVWPFLTFDSYAHRCSPWTRPLKARQTHWQAEVHPPLGQQGSICVMVNWEGKCHHSEYCLFFQLYLLLSYVMEYPRGQLGHVHVVMNPQTPQQWGSRKQKRPRLCVSPAQQEQKLLCIISPVFTVNPKHGLILATMKTINPTATKTRTEVNKDETGFFSTIIIHWPGF